MEFVAREIRAAILPPAGLTQTLASWAEITRRLAEPKRRRKRHSLS
jgi:hypothetical protein